MHLKRAQKLGNGTGGVGNLAGETNRDHPNCKIFKRNQNTEKSHGDLRRLAITQAPVNDHSNVMFGNVQDIEGNCKLYHQSRIKLAAGGQNLVEIKIKNDIFQGNSLTQLLVIF